MWQCEHSEVTRASESKIWNLWAQVEDWPTWDHALTYARLSGEFKEGGTLHLHFTHIPTVKSIITRCDLHRGFVTVSVLPFTKLIFSHEIFEQGELHKITYQVTCKGLLSFFWRRIIGRKIAKHLPSALQNLVKLAEAAEAPSPF